MLIIMEGRKRFFYFFNHIFKNIFLRFMKTSGFVRYLGGREDLVDYLHPKLIHFIAEHVHPSLAVSFKFLFFLKMNRVKSL